MHRNLSRNKKIWEMGMQTAFDVFFYLEPTYSKALRGATAGDVMFQSKSWRSTSDEGEWDMAADATDTKKYTAKANADELPLTPYTVCLHIDDTTVANDDGHGKIKGTDANGKKIEGTVDYTNGDFEINFEVAPATTAKVVVAGSIALEADDDLTVTQAVELQLRAQQFTLREFPITFFFAWAMAVLSLGTF